MLRFNNTLTKLFLSISRREAKFATFAERFGYRGEWLLMLMAVAAVVAINSSGALFTFINLR